jgi:hypothetical protein
LTARLAVTTIVASQLDHVRDEALLIGTSARLSSLRGTMLAQNAADATLRTFICSLT